MTDQKEAVAAHKDGSFARLRGNSGEVTFLRPKGRPKSDTICNVQKRKRHDLVVEN